MSFCPLLEVMQKADYILCDAEMQQRFPVRLNHDPILANSWQGMMIYQGKPWKELQPEEKQAYHQDLAKIWEGLVRQIKEKLDQGKTVALLDSGAPGHFGPAHWLSE